jgi:hypothetical protein
VKKIIVVAIVVIIMAVVSLPLLLRNLMEEGVASEYTFSNDWLKKGNIYVYFEPPLDYLRTVNATGVTWSVYYSGFNDSDKAYVDELHRNGFKVSSNFPTVQANITENQDLREIAHCVDVNGNPISFSGNQYAMCGNNPAWQEFLKSRIKEHIDGGADAIQIDEIGTSDCLCDYCVGVLNSYLSSHYSATQLHDLFGIDNIDSFNYRTYLLEKGAQNVWDDPNQNLLSAYFMSQYLSRVAFIHELIQYAREYAGRDILFSGNTYGLRPDQQIYVPDLDFMVFEMPIGYLPEGKQFTTYLLGEALAPSKPLVGFPDIFVLASISQDDWWLWRHWLAEAYASGGSFLLPYQAYTYGGGQYTLPADRISPYTNFISSHSDYYENVFRLAKVALLHDLNSTLRNQARGRAWAAWDNFESIGRALQGAHIPFEVVYAGDGEFVDKPITMSDLEKYSVVVIPDYYDLDVETNNLLDQFVQQGGRVVRADNIPDGSDLVAEIRGTSVDLGLETNASEDLSMMIYERENSLLIHLINYSYDNRARDFTPQTQIEITITIPTDVSLTGKTLRLMSPDAGQETTLEYTIRENRVTFVVPSIHEYSIASFE